MASKRLDTRIVLHKPVRGGDKSVGVILVDGDIPSFIRGVICDKISTLMNGREFTPDTLPGYVETVCTEVMVRMYNNYGLCFTKLVAISSGDMLVVTTKDNQPFDIWQL